MKVASNWFAPGGRETFGGIKVTWLTVAPKSAATGGLVIDTGKANPAFGSVKFVPKVRAVTVNLLSSVVATFDCSTAENPQPLSVVVDAQSEA